MDLHYRSLDVWKKAIALCEDVLKASESFPKQYQYSLGDQLRRAIMSVPSNIAEGAGRETPGDKKRFFGIARGSAYEASSHLEIALRRSFIASEQAAAFDTRLIEVARMLSGLMRRNTLP